jgi:hypothetical protein
VSVFAGVGRVLREVRLERRWTQEQLAGQGLHAEPPPPGEKTDDAAREAPTPQKSGGADKAIERRGISSPRIRSR